MPRSLKSAASFISAAIALATASNLFATVVNSSWTGALNSSWSNANNWNPLTAPNNTGGVEYNVLIGAPAPALLDINATIDSLTLNPGGSLQTLGSLTLGVVGPTITDNGSIIINVNSANAQTGLTVLANTTLSGAGTLSLSDNGNINNARLDTAANVTLTQAAGHTIDGHGTINAALINNGTVNADSTAGSAVILLQSNNMLNNNLFEATANGTLLLNAITVTQGSVALISAANGTVNVNNSAMLNGALSSSGTGVFNINGTSSFANLTSNATVHISGASNLIINGNITDNASITINATAANAQTALNFAGGTVSGSGDIILNDNGNPNSARLDGAFTQGANHSITGHGNINASLTNNGVINANTGSTLLNLIGATITNNNLIEATSGGVLLFGNGVAVTNTGALISAASGNVIIGGNASITGGTLNSTGSNAFTVNNASFTNLTLATGTQTLITGSLNLTFSGSSIVNNGTVVVNTSAANAQTSLTIASNLTLSGSGVVVLNDNGNANNARLDSAAGVVLTQAPGHSITGHGNVNAALINNGTIDADIPSSTLNINGPESNNSTIRATLGTLNINATTISQSPAAQILAGPGTVNLVGSAISHGLLNSSGGGVFQVFNTSSITSLTSNAPINILASYNLIANGDIVDNGLITVNSNAGNAQTSLDFAGGTLSGTGTIVLNDNANGNNARLDGALTQSSTHSITGHGNINAVLTNNGLVNANIASTFLNFNGPVNNNSLIEATLGAINFNSVNIIQAPNAQISANPGTVNINNSGISNGILNSPGGAFQIFGSSAISSLTSNAQINILASQNLSAYGNIVNNGTITVNSNSGNAQTSLGVGGGTFSGNGSIVLSDNGTGNNARLDGSLTQSASHSILGHGNINAVVTNNGLIDANVPSTTLNLNSTVNNNNVIETTLGNLAINAAIIQSPSAQITAAPGTAINLNFATINGGTLNTTGGIFQVTNSSTLLSLTNNATINLFASLNLSAYGDILDNGAIAINSNAGNAQTSLTVAGGIISGTGTFSLNDNGNPNNARLDGALTQGPNHTIAGHGNINAVVTNNGTISANVPATTLHLLGSTTNNGLLLATNGGTLNVPSGVLSNLGNATLIGGFLTLTGGTYRVDANSTLALSGSINTNAATILLNGPGYAFPAISTLTTNNGSLFVQNGAAASFASLLNAGNVTVAGSNSTLSLAGSYTQTANATLAGNGTLSASALFGNLSTIAGTVQVYPNAATSQLTTLTIAGSSNAWTGALNIANNKLILEASSSITKPTLLATLQNQIDFGKSHPAGILSSNLPAHTALALLDNAVTNFTTFGGLPVDSNSLLIAPELLGDANIDGRVDLTDLAIVLNNFNKPLLAWTDGNFDGNATIDPADVNAVLNNFGSIFPNASASEISNVTSLPTAPAPEPTTLSLLGFSALALLKRRRST